MLVALLECSAKVYSQKINLDETNSSLKKVLNQINKQTGYVFFYDSKDVQNKSVTIHLKDASIDEALKECLKNQSLTYKKVNNNIVLQQIEKTVDNVVTSLNVSPVKISGQVFDNKNIPLAGVTISVKGSQAITISDASGKFNIEVPDGNATLVFSFVGYVKKELQVTPGTPMLVRMEADVSGLSEIVVVAYGTQKKKT
ncbi:carboxypeptidase-like regulatory domain-containing protein [Mucilaginibacter sp. P25]|uniref:STN domain-containing protein n=1 Tax=unclassified Mucilaginibacter TaxID=2617802 RepID=UPI003D677994